MHDSLECDQSNDGLSIREPFDDNHLPNNNELTFKRIIIKREIIDDEYEAHIPQEGDIREVTPPPAPRAKSRRQSAELAKKRIKLEMRPIEVKMEEDKKNDVNYDSREGSCERSDCPLQKSCCLCISEMCLGSRVDGTGKLYTHITRGEHVCTNCYENVWNRGRNCYDRFMEWRSRWSAESRCSPSAKCFIQEQLLPFWLSCSKCECFRPLPENAPTPSPQEILSFECGRCSDVEDQLALDASERGWVTSMAVPPLLHNSPALIFLHGDSYFYDEIGMSPTNSEFVEGKEPPPSSQFIRPFNMPYESSVAFSLRPDCLEYDEIQAFPEYSVEPVPYLAARNLIIALWAQNPFEYLTPAFCLAHLVIRGLARVWFSCELRRIYDFLNMKGIINYGIIDLPSRPLSVYNDRPLEVIVVGAGISGLAAARQLRSFGVKVKILEAKAKVGGRMQDDWSLGVAVGCGAQLITGIVNNPISLMCQQMGDTSLFDHFVTMCLTMTATILVVNHYFDIPWTGTQVTPYVETQPTIERLSDGSFSFSLYLVTDLDHDSRVEAKKNTWQSLALTATLTLDKDRKHVKVSVPPESAAQSLVSSIAAGGRSMELSDLVFFNGRLLSCDDRTGLIYEIDPTKGKVFPWVFLPDGKGEKSSKGLKSEWMTVKDEQLYVGGLGKEWTTTAGEYVNDDPMWVKVVSREGAVTHLSWRDVFVNARKAIGIEYPGYMIHEAVQWSPSARRWFFLPRRASTEKYTEEEDEGRGTNVLISSSENFDDWKVVRIGDITQSPRGFSAFQFIPGTSDHLIVALKSEEKDGVPVASYITVFDVNGKILLPDQALDGPHKYEGIAFL